MKVKEFEPKEQSAKEILSQFSSGAFQARQLGTAFDIMKEMVKNKAKIILTVSGALVPAGLRKCIVEWIENGWVGSIVSTGANLTHDLASSFGEEYYFWHGESDAELRKKSASRIYDIVSPDKSSIKFEEEIQKILSELGGEMTPSQLLYEIGKRIKDKSSIVGSAAKKNVPIYCPALSDSILGFQVWMHQQDHDLKINEIKDLQRILDYMYSLQKNDKLGVIILGGGVPKNFALQAALITKQYDYAIQISTDKVEFGGLSGASLEEAISWGKIKPGANVCKVDCDATIAFPLLVSALKEEFKK